MYLFIIICLLGHIMQQLPDKNISNYWIGPFGVLVANNINSVVAEDGGNTLHKNGSMTKMCCMDRISKETYLEKYATRNKSDNKWYYNDTPSESILIENVAVIKIFWISDFFNNLSTRFKEFFNNWLFKS